MSADKIKNEKWKTDRDQRVAYLRESLQQVSSREWKVVRETWCVKRSLETLNPAWIDGLLTIPTNSDSIVDVECMGLKFQVVEEIFGRKRGAQIKEKIGLYQSCSSYEEYSDAIISEAFEPEFPTANDVVSSALSALQAKTSHYGGSISGITLLIYVNSPKMFDVESEPSLSLPENNWANIIVTTGSHTIIAKASDPRLMEKMGRVWRSESDLGLEQVAEEIGLKVGIALAAENVQKE